MAADPDADVVVQVDADLDRVEQKIINELSEAGRDGGEALDKSLNQSVRQTGDKSAKALADQLKSALAKGAREAGQEAGKGVADGLREETDLIEQAARDAGDQAVLAFEDAFGSEAGNRLASQFSDAMREGLRTDWARQKAAEIGAALTEGLSDTAARQVIAQLTKDFEAEFDRITAAARETEQELDDSGSRIGSIFSRIASTLGEGASQIGAALSAFSKSPAGLATMVTAIGAVVGQILALASTAAQAINIIGAVPALMAARFAVLGTIQLALQGFDEALSALADNDMTAFAASLERLAPAAQAVAREFALVMPALQSIQQAAQQAVFAPLEGELTRIVALLTGPAQQAFTTLGTSIGNFGAQLAQVIGSASTAQILVQVFGEIAAAVDAIAPGIGTLASGLLELVSAVSPILKEMAGDIGTLAQEFGTWLTEVSRSGEALAAVREAWEVIKSLGAVLKEATSAVLTFLNIVSRASGGTKSINDLATAFADLNKWMQDNVGVIAAVVAALRTMAAISSALLGVIRNIVTTIFDLGRVLAAVMIGDLQQAASVVEGIGERWAETFSNLASGVETAFQDALRATSEGASGFDEAAQQLPESAGKAVTGVESAFKGLPGAVKVPLDQVLTNMQQAIQAFSTLEGATFRFTLNGDNFKVDADQAALIAQVAQALAPIAPEISRILGESLKVGGPEIEAAVKRIGDVFRALPLEAQAALAQLPAAVQERFKEALDTTALGQLAKEVPQLFKNITPEVGAALAALGPTVQQAIGQAFKGVDIEAKNATSKIVENLKGLGPEALAALAGVADQLPKPFAEAVTKALAELEKLKEPISSGNWLTDAFSGLGEKVSGLFSNLFGGAEAPKIKVDADTQPAKTAIDALATQANTPAKVPVTADVTQAQTAIRSLATTTPVQVAVNANVTAAQAALTALTAAKTVTITYTAPTLAAIQTTFNAITAAKTVAITYSRPGMDELKALYDQVTAAKTTALTYERPGMDELKKLYDEVTTAKTTALTYERPGMDELKTLYDQVTTNKTITLTFQENGLDAISNAIDALERTVTVTVVENRVSDDGGGEGFARGGIVSSPTWGVFGEAGPEVIIPLSKPGRAVELARRSGLADMLADSGGVAGAGGMGGGLPTRRRFSRGHVDTAALLGLVDKGRSTGRALGSGGAFRDLHLHSNVVDLEALADKVTARITRGM